MSASVWEIKVWERVAGFPQGAREKEQKEQTQPTWLPTQQLSPAKDSGGE